MNKPYSFARGRSKQVKQSRFDVASFIDIGERPYQQDTILADFPNGEDIGIGVLADGMGGHLGGEVASNRALSAAFAEIKVQMVRYRAGQITIPDALRLAVDRANAAVAGDVASLPELTGMGTTLVICVVAGPQLYWASVGDSPLYLFRDGTLQQLNADHSMGPQIDAMVVSGIIDAAEAATHPQRNQLLSAVCGSDIAQIDCPETPFLMAAGDILLLASDGIQTLTDDAISRVIRKKRRLHSDEIAHELMQAVIDAENPAQDNASLILLKLENDAAVLQPLPQATPAPDRPQGGHQPQCTIDNPQLEQASDLLNKALSL